MPPQPLSNVKRGARVRWGPETLSERPELAIITIQAIAEWSETEAELASLFAALIGAPFTPATAAFFALTSGPGQLAVMETFAGEHLKGITLHIFRAVILVYRRQHKARNFLAHWRYAVSDDIPDAILLMDQAEHKKVESENIDALRKVTPGAPLMSHEEALAINARILKSIYVYKKNDLLEISNSAIQVRLWISRIIIAFGAPEPIRELTLHPLLGEPMIRAEVEKSLKQDQNSP